MNKVVKIHFKAVTTKFFTVVGIIVEPSTYIIEPKVYLEAYPYIS